MTIEILLIKRSQLVMGPPAVAAAVVLASFMLSSGLGSHISGRRMNRGLRPQRVFPIIVLTAAAVYFIIPSLLSLPIPVRAAALFLLAAAPAFLMGFPFPSALMIYENNRECLVAWAWALNGYTSVIGSSLAGVMAVTKGFNALLILGTVCYLVAGWIFSTQLSDHLQQP
jgi:predicted MFS family arabinose efflux permease